LTVLADSGDGNSLEGAPPHLSRRCEPGLPASLSLDPHRKEARENIGDLFFKIERRDEAKKHYQEFLALFPASFRAEEIHKILERLN
jgi:tetratricopeptide (TPR) repeat protein